METLNNYFIGILSRFNYFFSWILIIKSGCNYLTGIPEGMHHATRATKEFINGH